MSIFSEFISNQSLMIPTQRPMYLTKQYLEPTSQPSTKNPTCPLPRRNLQSAGQSATKLTCYVTNKTATGLVSWATTDHSGMNDSMSRMPSMDFWDTILHSLIHFSLAVVGALLTAVWIYLLLVYALPFFITGHF